MKCLALLFSLHLLSVPACTLSCSGCDQLIRTRDARCTIPSDSLVFYEPCASVFTENSSTPCDVRVGLALTVDCSDDDAVLYWNAEPIGNQSVLVIPFVRPEHRGVYDCRSTNDTVLAQRLLIVNEETQVAGGPSGTACFPFQCVEEFECCSPINFQSIAFVGQVLSFNVYGKDPEVSWETVQWQNHHGVDLKLRLIPNALTSVQELKIGRRPKVVRTGPENPSDPVALVRVTASNNSSTSSACFNLNFFDDPTLIANGSLPVNETVQEGRDAFFECVMGAALSAAFSTGVHIQYELNGTVDPWLCQGFECVCRGSCRSEITGRQVNSALLSTEYSYEIKVASVVAAENGALVSCALLNDNVTQWRREATLTVVPATYTLLATPTGNTPTSDTPTSDRQQYIVVVVVLAVVILIIGVAIAVVLILCTRRVTITGKPDQVPLRNGNVSVTPETSPLPPMVVDTAFLEGQPPPSITVTTSGGGVERGVANGRSSPHSMDSGHCGSICSVDMDAPAPATTVNPRRSRSLADLLSEHNKWTRIYVSYSNCKSQWVAGYLKPLIESFPGTEVTIHDTDMIAGQPISVERLRLIVQADKVVIVCSPDYAQSPWCQYELYQAIAKQPSLAEGRIIPVLCDGCSCPPPEVRAVVCLSDRDEMFPAKLKAALIRLHRSSS